MRGIGHRKKFGYPDFGYGIPGPLQTGDSYCHASAKVAP